MTEMVRDKSDTPACHTPTMLIRCQYADIDVALFTSAITHQLLRLRVVCLVDTGQITRAVGSLAEC
jgi:hypothetical protein